MRLIKYVLFALIILSAIIIFQVNFNFPPKISVNLSNEVIMNINSLANDVSIGLLVSIFFWWIIQCIPDIKKRNSIHKIIEPKIRIVVLQMEAQIGMILRENDINKDIKELKPEDLKDIKKIENSITEFKYEIMFKNWVPIHPKQTKRILLLNDQKNNIIKVINEIFQLPNLIFEDDSITNCLSSIKESCFLDLFETTSKDEDINNSEIGFFLYDYIEKMLLLKKYFSTQSMRY